MQRLFTHPIYEGWNSTHGQLPSYARAAPTSPVENGQGCCHTSAYMNLIDEVHVPQARGLRGSIFMQPGFTDASFSLKIDVINNMFLVCSSASGSLALGL
jgi:hypothetical protein